MKFTKCEEKFITMRTAILTAYPKIFTDIEHAREFFAAAIQSAVHFGFTFEPSMFVSDMAIELEARHKALSRKLQAIVSGKALIIELGAGLSSRKLEFRDYDYIELDLTTIIELKTVVYEKTNNKDCIEGLRAVDLTQVDEIKEAIKMLDLSKYDKIIVVSEGLFWYLKRVDVDRLLSCFLDLFKNKNWLWLTADCPVADLVDADYRNVIADSAKKSQIEPFSDYVDFYNYFAKKGFLVDRFLMKDIIAPEEIYSSSLFAIPVEETELRMLSYTDIALLDYDKN